MQRDMNLVKKILLAIEEESSTDSNGIPDIEGHSQEEIAYHMIIMDVGEAGLIFTNTDTLIGQQLPIFTSTRLTWEGHNFLDASKNDESSWRKAVEAAGGLGFETLKTVLFELVQQTARNAVGLE